MQTQHKRTAVSDSGRGQVLHLLTFVHNNSAFLFRFPPFFPDDSQVQVQSVFPSCTSAFQHMLCGCVFLLNIMSFPNSILGIG